MVPSAAGEVLWNHMFAVILMLLTWMLIGVGGLVTAFHAGLEVPDWPRSYGYNMFLFPLSLMQQDSGAFYEHSHRLLASLVGFTSLGGWRFIRRWRSGGGGSRFCRGRLGLGC